MIRYLTAISLLIPGILMAQKPAHHSSSDIYLEMQKLNVLGNVLYVAAHPDDENTQMITYFSKGKLVNTAYFACTRGDGGQNLLGPEIEYRLGVIRTLELLQARKIDGGRQFFSRAIDFGYSKNPTETFQFWDKDKILSDLVWVIREFRPDVIITRFDTTAGITHGHHTASAILAMEAFKKSGDPDYDSGQLKYVKPWSPSKLFWNTAWWYFRNNNIKMDTTALIRLDVGGYNPLLGQSYSEIAAEARSMHKSQGFGVTASRGDDMEYLKQWAGTPSVNNVFDGIDISWNRVKGGQVIQNMVNDLIKNFKPDDPSKSIPGLLIIRKSIENLSDPFWKEKKLKEIDQLIYDCSGLYLEAVADKQVQVEGDSIKIRVETINRSPVNISLDGIMMDHTEINKSLKISLPYNRDTLFSIKGIIPEDMPVSEPYWLVNKHGTGNYVIPNQQMAGKPWNDPPLTMKYKITVEGKSVEYSIPVIYKYNDPIHGEVYKSLTIAPPVVTDVEKDVEIFNGGLKKISVKVISNRDKFKGTLSFDVDKKWNISPSEYDISLDKDSSRNFTFTVTPPADESEDVMDFKITAGNKSYDRGMESINYPHIPEVYLYPLSEIKLVNLHVKIRGKMIGYLQGAGDEIPDGLEQLGYSVTELKGNDLGGDLSRFNSIVIGVRAFNTIDQLSKYNSNLFNYVRNGGTLIVQYNNNYRMVTTDVSPYPLSLSRDRITNEDSPVRIIAPDNPIMTDPNLITEKDFEGWVQERGLYFPNKWDSHFTAVISSEDPGEKPLTGGILVAKYGSGYYIYTSLSWFREIPDGVPGAYRIFANMLSLGN